MSVLLLSCVRMRVSECGGRGIDNDGGAVMRCVRMEMRDGEEGRGMGAICLLILLYFIRACRDLAAFAP